MAQPAGVLAKLTRPRLFAAAPRNRLLALLDDCRTRPVVWIEGPPGAGKTTLVASWLEARRLDAIWYQLDESDGDPAAFFHYLAQARPRLQRARGAPLPALTPEHLPQAPAFARRFFRTLCARYRQDTAIVLHNYQELRAGSLVHQLLAVAAEELPENFRLIVISRAAAPQSFARLAAARQLAVIDWDDLRLRFEETCDMARHEGLNDPGMLRVIHEQCAGWAGGLTLVLEQVRHAGVTDTFRYPQSLDKVFDYFADQVFLGAAPATQDFLLRTAFAPRMTVALAEALSGHAQAGPILERLHRHHLFTERRLAERVQYQYHALFRRFLIERATRTLPPEECRRLQGEAARLLSDEGFFEDAIGIRRDAGDWDGLTGAIVARAPALLAQGRFQTLREWIESLPQDWPDRVPDIAYWLGTALLSVDQERGRLALERAFALYSADGNTLGQLSATSGIIEARFLQHANHRLIDPWLPVHEKLLDRVGENADADLLLRANSAMLLSLLYRRPDHPRLTVCVQEVLRLLDEDASANQQAVATTFLMWYAGYTGDFALVRRIAARGEALAARSEVTDLNRGTWSNWLGYCHGFAFDLQAARSALDRAEKIGDECGLPAVTFLACYFRGLAEAKDGQHELAERYRRRAAALANPESRIQTAILHAFTGWLAVMQQQPQQALRSGRAAWEIGQELGSPSYLVHWGTPLVYGLVETGRHDEARERSSLQRAGLAGTPIRCFDAMFLCIEATLALREDGEAAALPLVQRMFDIASRHEQGGYLALLQPWLPRLAAIALAHGTAVPYVRELISIVRCEPPGQDALDWPWTWTIRTLGWFEVEREGRPVEYGRKTPRKPLALLRALIAAGPAGAADSALIDLLWPDEEADAAHRSLASTIHRVRALLGSPETIQLKDHCVRLNARRVWVDAWAFEEMLARADTTRAERTDAQCQAALALYRGAFLPHDLDSPWTLSMRERLRSRFVRCAADLALRLETAGNFAAAADLYRQALAVDDLAEPLYQGLLRCLSALGRIAEAVQVYRQMKECLACALGTRPSAQSESLYRALSGR
jgi:pentatricopeptide repeat protein